MVSQSWVADPPSPFGTADLLPRYRRHPQYRQPPPQYKRPTSTGTSDLEHTTRNIELASIRDPIGTETLAMLVA